MSLILGKGYRLQLLILDLSGSDVTCAKAEARISISVVSALCLIEASFLSLVRMSEIFQLPKHRLEVHTLYVS